MTKKVRVKRLGITLYFLLFCTLLIGSVLPTSGQVIKNGIVLENDENNPLINGDIWMKTYDVRGRDCGYSVLQTEDGGYIVTGRSYTYPNLEITDWIIKTGRLKPG